MPLQQQESFEDRGRPRGEEFLVPNIEKLVDRLEVGIDRLHADLRREQAGVQVLQKDDVDLPNRLRGTVIALHELLGRASRCGIDESQLAGERALDVEHQSILAPAGKIVQPDAQIVDQPLVPREIACFGRSHQAVRSQIAPGAAEARGTGDPQDRLQIAPAAGAFLEVGLEVIGGVLVAQMALLLLQRFRLVESAHVERGVEAPGEARKQCARSREQAALEKARADDRIGRHLGFAFLDRAYAVTDLEAGVPHQADEALDGACPAGGALVDQRPRRQDHDVDVGMGKQFAAAVTADRHQRAAGRWVDLSPKSLQYPIGQARLSDQQTVRLTMLPVGAFQRATASIEFLLPARCRRVRAAVGRGNENGAQDGETQLVAGGGGVPDESVNTS